MADREFTNRALESVHAVRREFLKISGDAPNAVIDQFADDLDAVLKRLRSGYRCANAKCRVLIPGDKLREDAFCSQRCRGAVQARAIEGEQRVTEAMSQYAEGADA